MMMLFSGYQPLGVRKTERCLPVGTPLTVVGELDRITEKGETKYVLGRPNSGAPFYITDRSVEDLKSSIKQVARNYAVASPQLPPLPQCCLL